VVVDGAWAGWSLARLWQEKREEIFGVDGPDGPFPILCKVLDAREKLSVQVHPPTAVCGELQGEPKDEVWYLMDADPGSKLYVGLRAGATREALERSLDEGGTEGLLHTLTPVPGESIFLPSGRLHAIGGGFLILEIQQNSDTTYRVYDWGRVGLDGKPRQLHVPQAMRSIDFADVEPGMRPAGDGELVRSPAFFVNRHTLSPGDDWKPEDGRFRIVVVAEGAATCGGAAFKRGAFFLLPKDGAPVLAGDGGAVLLEAGV
jgi:mannose-6-phosphate isomerase